MYTAYRADTIRAAELPLLATQPGVLMGRAAYGLATAVLRDLRAGRGRAYGARVLLAVGAGNNGADALYAGITLISRGVDVRAWLVSGRAHPEAWAAFRASGGRSVDALAATASLAEVDLVIDGVLGIGGRPGLAPAVALFAAGCRDAGVRVVAVDLPSGLDPDSPNRLEVASFDAALTVTFGGRKLCQVLEPARSRCGRVELIDIALNLDSPDLSCWEASDVAAAWPFPDARSDKYSRGVVGLDTGSATYPGAGVLSVLAAAHAGAGMVRFTGSAAVADQVRAAAPNVVFGPGRVQARVLGCGWGDRPDGHALVADAVNEGLGLVIDADGLRYLPPGKLGAQVLLTPHAGELGRLLGQPRASVEADPMGAVQAAVDEFGATVLLKGATQYVAAPSRRCLSIAVPGPAWTAQAGSGDVLAGVCGALVAAGLPPWRAALAAASVQAMVAAKANGPQPPQTSLSALCAVVAALRPEAPQLGP